MTNRPTRPLHLRVDDKIVAIVDDPDRCLLSLQTVSRKISAEALRLDIPYVDGRFRVPCVLVERLLGPFLTDVDREVLRRPLAASRRLWQHHVSRASVLPWLERWSAVESASGSPRAAEWEGVSFQDPTTGRTLRPTSHQVAGVIWIEQAGRRAILGDEMGLGKTPMSLFVLGRAMPRRTLVVAPKAVVMRWVEEARRFAPRLKAVPLLTRLKIEGFAKDTSPAPLIGVVTWGALTSALPALLSVEWVALVLDEVHYAKDPTSARSQAAVELAHRAEMLLALTGTVILNRPPEIWNVLHMIDPHRWPVFDSFGRKYCQSKLAYKPNGNSVIKWTNSTEEQLKQINSVVRPYRLMRKKSVVLKGLAPMTWVTERIAAPESAVEAYRSFLDLLDSAADDGVMATEALALIHAMRLECGMLKVGRVVEMVRELHAQQEPSVVMIYHTEVQHLYEEHLAAAGLRFDSIVGSVVSAKRRKRIEQQFHDGKLDVIIGSEAAREGLDLTRSCNLFFGEYWWQPGGMMQGASRIHRITQRRPVRLVLAHLGDPDALDTWDSHMRRMLRDKQGQALGVDGLSSDPSGFIESLRRVIR